MNITWTFKHNHDLDKHELYAVLALRTAVFVVEQNCPYQEVDGKDLEGDTCHLMAWRDGELIAYLRLLDPQRHAGQATIGRVATAANARGLGLGHRLMERAVAICAERWPGAGLYLSAQAHLQNYYGRHGFQAVTEAYLEDGIPHVGMRRD
ncbi:GNAT family N-acetyltransferase [Pseudomonas sp. LRF_L74]|uniref:GNAT family N-acetyltransferase n=1 Tax=Pseudomonas sp. LRF_L74 TaxID=3369422 RepID=UPI003F60D2DA